MKILFFGTKPYDEEWFKPMAADYGFEICFVEAPLNLDTVMLAVGFDAICIFVNDEVTKEIIDELYKIGVKAILLRCAGFNHIDLKAAKGKIKICRVPSYSPEAVAEYAMALLLTVNRKTHKAYNRTREFNMSINGLTGTTLYNKTAGVIGTGKIGQAMIRILKGFGMRVLAYDIYPDKNLDVEYVPLEKLIEKSDVITLHCPLTMDTKYMINEETIEKMKDGVYLINTSRGALIDSKALINGLLNKKFAGVGLDVYDEEDGIFFEDCSGEIVKDEVLARLLTFPNVLITSHQGFFTEEAMQAIAVETLENAYALDNDRELVNEVKLN